jgi:hypothetical protein
VTLKNTYFEFGVEIKEKNASTEVLYCFELDGRCQKNDGLSHILEKLTDLSTKTLQQNQNRSNVEHKVVLILSFQLISNIFYISLHIF